MDGEYLARMEDLLDLYELGYNRKRPVICFDERPCQLLGDLMGPIPMKPGSVKKLDYQYQRKGSCTLFLACEPLEGLRDVAVTERRTKVEYAQFMKELAEKHYADAEKLVVVQDNLSTPSAGAFYEAFDAETARGLARKFEFHYTPRKGSWLNMAEIEIAGLSKQCLDRRIATVEELRKQVRACAKRRNRERTRIEWRFTTMKARKKLKRHYDNIKN